MDDREIDALVAEHVMGLGPVTMQPCQRNPDCGQWYTVGGIPGWEALIYKMQPCIQTVKGDDEFPAYYQVLPHYSTDIGAAWAVVERMNTQDDATFERWTTDSALYERGRNPGVCLLIELPAAHAARAICLAALRAAGVEVAE